LCSRTKCVFKRQFCLLNFIDSFAFKWASLSPSSVIKGAGEKLFTLWKVHFNGPLQDRAIWHIYWQIRLQPLVAQVECSIVYIVLFFLALTNINKCSVFDFFLDTQFLFCHLMNIQTHFSSPPVRMIYVCMYFYYVYNFIFFVVAFLDDKNKQQRNTLYRLKPLKKKRMWATGCQQTQIFFVESK